MKREQEQDNDKPDPLSYLNNTLSIEMLRPKYIIPSVLLISHFNFKLYTNIILSTRSSIYCKFLINFIVNTAAFLTTKLGYSLMIFRIFL